MAQNLEFSATSGLTLTATAYAIGAYSGGTNAGSVTQQVGTNRYLAAFASNLTAGAWRLDFLVSGTCIGQEVYDVDGSGTYQPRSETDLNTTIEAIAAKTALIGTASAMLQAPVSSQGKIAQIFIGDDYLSANGRAFQWTITEPTGFTAATSTCSFGGEDKDGNKWLVSGTITDQGSTWLLSFDADKIATAVPPGIYDWTVEVKSATNVEHTVSFGGDTRLRKKYT